MRCPYDLAHIKPAIAYVTSALHLLRSAVIGAICLLATPMTIAAMQ
jgi:hypothetical protein